MPRMPCLLALALALSPDPVAAAAIEYRLEFLPQEGELAVRACLREPQSALRFSLPDADAAPFLLEARRDDGRELQREGNALRARDWRPDECLHLRIDARRVAAAAAPYAGLREGPDLLLPTRAWFWRPRGLAGGSGTEVTVVLPAGWTLSAPWQPLDAPPHRHFRLDDSDPGWPGMVAIGRFDERDIVAGSGALRLALTGAPAPTQQAILARHVGEVAADVLAGFPRLLDARPQLLLVPVPGAREPAPFGQSLRGGGTGIVLYANPRATLAQLRGSWTLTHELVHLAHPYLGDEGSWIAEGLATWYQNVLRARAGRMTPGEAWRYLAAGFERGRADAADASLRETARGDAGRHTMRVYWSGTALMLLGDVALRTRADAPASLDLALSRYLACCRAQRVRREPGRFLADLDRTVGGDTLAALYRAHADASAFPDLAPAWRALGITLRGDADLAYSDDPAAAALREAIMGPAR